MTVTLNLAGLAHRNIQHARLGRARETPRHNGGIGYPVSLVGSVSLLQGDENAEESNCDQETPEDEDDARSRVELF